MNSNLQIEQLAVGGFDHNFSYFISSDNHQDFFIVDPAGRVLEYVTQAVAAGRKLQGILITHSHFDHVERVPDLLQQYDVPVYMHHRAAARVSTIPSTNLRLVKEGDHISIGNQNLVVLHTPGHIDDAICFHQTDTSAGLITGDTLFVEGCGRADLAGSQVEALYDSLNRIKMLDDRTVVYPGHNYGSKPISDLAWEKQHNKYLLCRNFDDFRALRLPMT